MGQLSVKDLITIHDLTKEDINKIFKKTTELKRLQKTRQPHALLQNRTICAFYEKPSLRTRVSFEVAMVQLGGHAIYMKAIPEWKHADAHLKESDEDLARVLSRYVDAIVARTFSHEKIERLAQFASIPVVNALSDLTHPCQTLTDLYTMWEHKKKLEGLKVAYIGDGGNNMAHSTMLGCAKIGAHLTIAAPNNPKYQPNPKIMQWATEDAKETGSIITIVNDPKDALKDADVVYTDVWISMGMESEKEQRLQDFQGFQLNDALMQHAPEDAIVMHCLPRTPHEITDSVATGPQSVIYDQAENRLHVQKAILVLLMT